MAKWRVMIEGEDHSVWCEVNDLTEDEAHEQGPELCAKYENATWFVERQESYNPMDYEEDW